MYSSKMEAVAGMQKLREEDECNRRVAKGVSLGSTHTKLDFSAGRDGGLTGKQVCDPLSHANATSRATTHSPRSSPDHLDWGGGGGGGGVGLLSWGHRWRIPFPYEPG